MKPVKIMPTDAEVEILQVLWESGPSTVRQVHEKLSSHSDRGYTTILKLMQIMADKGLVRRQEDQRAHVYIPNATAEQTQKKILNDVLKKVYSGSAGKLVMQALSAGKTTPEELDEIRSFLDKLGRSES
jgi:BlaI family transcriptional regulator, penicillinase repressor